jgi:nucleoid-associated protein YgaU
MFLRGSRYARARSFEPDADGGEAFPGVRAREIGPATGVIEHVVQAGDRLDLLARHYYNDDRLWWRIVDANPRFMFAGHMVSEAMEGEVILIPRARE